LLAGAPPRAGEAGDDLEAIQNAEMAEAHAADGRGGGEEGGKAG